MALPLILSITANIFLAVAMGRGFRVHENTVGEPTKSLVPRSSTFAHGKCRQGLDTIVALVGAREGWAGWRDGGRKGRTDGGREGVFKIQTRQRKNLTQEALGKT